MLLDARIGSDPSKAAPRAERLEADGFDGVWVAELVHNPFLALALASYRTDRITLGSSLAVAFARNPMTSAQAGWDLQLVSEGRFNLGLASQIRTHITRRFSMPWSKPAARMEEYVGAMHAIWDYWEHGRKLDFRGDFYQHTFSNPMVTPPPHVHGRPKVHLGAVGPLMTRTAGRVADGVQCHSLATGDYVRDIMMPNVRRASEEAGRPDGAVEVTVFPFIVAAETEGSFEAQMKTVRSMMANGCSTPAYRGILEHHGWGEVQTEMRSMTRQGRWAEMPHVLDDEIVHTIAAVGTPAEVAAILLARYGDVADRLLISMPIADGSDGPCSVYADLRKLTEILRETSDDSEG